jgi:hypothetical protein
MSLQYSRVHYWIVQYKLFTWEYPSGEIFLFALISKLFFSSFVYVAVPENTLLCRWLEGEGAYWFCVEAICSRNVTVLPGTVPKNRTSILFYEICILSALIYNCSGEKNWEKFSWRVIIFLMITTIENQNKIFFLFATTCTPENHWFTKVVTYHGLFERILEKNVCNAYVLL